MFVATMTICRGKWFFICFFKVSQGLLSTIVVNYLNVTFNLNSGTYYPYRKPNDQPLCINTKSNHPPSIIKQLPKNISHRISSLSCNEIEFSKIKPTYEDALKSCGFNQPLTYSNHDPAASRRKNRQRNII